MITELIQYLHVAEDLFCGDNTYLRMPIYKTVLHALVEAKEVSACDDLLCAIILGVGSLFMFGFSSTCRVTRQ